jgi:outer membrane protein assembly factor BamB
MKKQFFTYLVVLAGIFLVVTGCSDVAEYVSGEDDIKPTELHVFRPALHVKLVWSRQLNAVTERNEHRLDPVEIDGVIYLAEPEGRIVAHNAENVRMLWEVLLKTGITGGVGKTKDAILLGTEDVEVIAMDLKDGHKKWTVKVSSEIMAPPQMKDDLAIIYSVDGVVTAVNTVSGKRVWSSHNAVPSLSLHGTSVPLIADDMVISGHANGKLVALDINSGKKIWETTIAVPRGRSELARIVDLDSGMKLLNGVIYVASYQGQLAAVDQKSGQINWVRELSSYQDIEIADSHIYIIDAKSQIWALDTQSGATLWRQDRLKGRFVTSPVVQNEYVIVGDFDGFVHWLSREDGHVLARQNLELANTAAYIVGHVYLDDDSEVGDIDFKVISGIISSPLVVGNMVYVSDKGGVLAAYRVGEGV